jgi:hypothetical protein
MQRAVSLNHLGSYCRQTGGRSNLLVERKLCAFQTFGRIICKYGLHPVMIYREMETERARLMNEFTIKMEVNTTHCPFQSSSSMGSSPSIGEARGRRVSAPAAAEEAAATNSGHQNIILEFIVGVIFLELWNI